MSTVFDGESQSVLNIDEGDDVLSAYAYVAAVTSVDGEEVDEISTSVSRPSPSKVLAFSAPFGSLVHFGLPLE